MSLLRPRKALGQNFLRDARVARRIVESVHPQAGDTILEIGPGEGALTEILVDTPARLILVEVDERAIPLLTARFGSRVEVLHADVLTLEPERLGGGALRVVGNIPYYITTPILFHFLDHRTAVRDLTLMMQREVGHRLAAPPGSRTYGITSVIAQWMADVRLLFDVPPGAFYPRPAVVSSVVSLSMLPAPRAAVREEAFFRDVVRTAFGQRRKTLRNSLARYPREGLGRLAPELLTRRPEQLSVGEFAALANTLFDAAHSPAASIPEEHA